MGPDDGTDARLDSPCGESLYEDDDNENSGSAFGAEET
jgi:hypothetical protein